MRCASMVRKRRRRVWSGLPDNQHPRSLQCLTVQAGAVVATPSRRRVEDSLRLIELSIVDSRNRIKRGVGEAGLYDFTSAGVASHLKVESTRFGPS
jgi:hypothetical protein